MSILNDLKNFLRKVRRKNISVDYEPLIKIFIFRDNILRNLREYQALSAGVAIAPVLKSNAYGHGLVQVAEILDGEQLPFFMVDSFFEAKVLRGAGIKTAILILGFVPPDIIRKSNLKNVSFGIVNLAQLGELSATLESPKTFHLKVDTGMRRQGIAIGELDEAVDLAIRNENIFIEGICSHLADADGGDESFTLKQISAWNKVAVLARQKISTLKYFHLSSTIGARFIDKIDANVMRLGKGLYGMESLLVSGTNPQPAMEVRSIIAGVKEIKAGDKVGYNITYTADKKITAALVPAGYYEGIDRRLSNKGFLKVRGKFCPIIGRVSMNITEIDVTELMDNGGVKAGDEVILLSARPKDLNSAENIAAICGTIALEILVRLPPHLKRVVK